MNLLKAHNYLVAQLVKHLPTMQGTWVLSLGQKFPWRRKWQPTPVFLPGESHGQRILVGSVHTTERLTLSLSQLPPGLLLSMFSEREILKNNII